MISNELLRASLKNLHGFLPVYKPRGINCLKLIYALKADLHSVLNNNQIRHGEVRLDCARYLEPFASGLITLVIGKAYRRRRNFLHADYEYKFVVELGVEREYNCIDGKILSSCNVESLPFKLIKTAAKSFVGEHEQGRCHIIADNHDSSYFPDLSPDIKTYDCIDIPPKEVFEARLQQKYPLVHSGRKVVCRNIQLVRYDKPFITFTIKCNGALAIRQLVADFARMLGTKASIVELTRIHEGPISVKDLRLLQIHELNFEYYSQRLEVLQESYNHYIAQYDDLFEQPLDTIYSI